MISNKNLHENIEILNNYFMLKEYNVMVNYVFFVFCTIILTFQPMKYAVQLQKIHTFMNDLRQFIYVSIISKTSLGPLLLQYYFLP